MGKISIIAGAVVAIFIGVFVFLSVWDPPPPSEEIKKDITDELLS